MKKVVAAVIVDDADRVLCSTQRASGQWEFPGGKVEVGESSLAALKRELDEELALELLAATPWLCTHNATIGLEFWWSRTSGLAVAREGQQLRWLDRVAIDPSEFAPLDQLTAALLRDGALIASDDD
jgi:8-oxo-dGTP diphosphatase